MKARIAIVASIAALAVSGFAAGAITENPGNGNPDTNAAGKCPGGQNKETSPGGVKKCP